MSERGGDRQPSQQATSRPRRAHCTEHRLERVAAAFLVRHPRTSQQPAGRVRRRRVGGAVLAKSRVALPRLGLVIPVVFDVARRCRAQLAWSRRRHRVGAEERAQPRVCGGVGHREHRVQVRVEPKVAFSELGRCVQYELWRQWWEWACNRPAQHRMQLCKLRVAAEHAPRASPVGKLTDVDAIQRDGAAQRQQLWLRPVGGRHHAGHQRYATGGRGRRLTSGHPHGALWEWNARSAVGGAVSMEATVSRSLIFPT